MTTPVICFNFTNSSIHFWCNSVYIQALKILSNTLGLPIYTYTNLVVNILWGQSFVLFVVFCRWLFE